MTPDQELRLLAGGEMSETKRSRRRYVMLSRRMLVAVWLWGTTTTLRNLAGVNGNEAFLAVTSLAQLVAAGWLTFLLVLPRRVEPSASFTEERLRAIWVAFAHHGLTGLNCPRCKDGERWVREAEDAVERETK